MLTLGAALCIPEHVMSTTLENEAVLLNTLTNKYYSLNEVGARFWSLLAEGRTLRQAHQVLLEEFEVEPPRLEQDLLDLIRQLREDGLVAVTEV
jgi:hypothetical protein